MFFLAAIERGHMCRQLSTITWDLVQQGGED